MGIVITKGKPQWVIGVAWLDGILYIGLLIYIALKFR